MYTLQQPLPSEGSENSLIRRVVEHVIRYVEWDIKLLLKDPGNKREHGPEISSEERAINLSIEREKGRHDARDAANFSELYLVEQEEGFLVFGAK